MTMIMIGLQQLKCHDIVFIHMEKMIQNTKLILLV